MGAVNSILAPLAALPHVLSWLIILPVLTAAAIFFLAPKGEAGASIAKKLALVGTVITFVLTLALWAGFDPAKQGFQYTEMVPWFKGYGISYYVGIDGISLSMLVLTGLLMPICIACGWDAITTRVREYLIAFLLLEAMVMGVFVALDLLVFYIFFEGMLIPMYLIIGIWGGDKRVYAAYKFFLYTLAGSILFLVALLYLYASFGTMSIPALMEQVPALGLGIQQWLWLALFASFAVKVPMWPFHTWLPDAHVQAPTAGSVILAGILLKMGAYGFLRFSLPMLPEASRYFADFVFVLSAVAVVYTSLVALMQTDMKKLIAYSSVAHMGYVTMGIFSFNAQGVEGAIVQMISHGLVSGALFLCVGVLYDRVHTKEIARYGGVVNVMPVFAACFLVFTMASAGLPGTAGFVGEILVLIGTFKVSQWAALFAATGLILGAAYILWLYKRVIFGEVANDEIAALSDIGRRERAILYPLVVLVIAMGVYPKPVTDMLHTPVNYLLQQVNPAEEEREEYASLTGRDDAHPARTQPHPAGASK